MKLGAMIFAGLVSIALPSQALPMLSADGSLLSGVDVAGTVYDVMFGDGIPGTVFADVNFDAARVTEANAVSEAIVAALISIGGIDATAIAGCDGPIERIGICILFNPDTFSPAFGGLFFFDDAPAEYFGDALGWGRDDGDFLGLVLEHPNTSSHSAVTLVEYAPRVPVPNPATLALFGLGLAGLGITRRKRIAQV